MTYLEQIAYVHNLESIVEMLIEDVQHAFRASAYAEASHLSKSLDYYRDELAIEHHAETVLANEYDQNDTVFWWSS
jgi:hypothetical protein